MGPRPRGPTPTAPCSTTRRPGRPATAPTASVTSAQRVVAMTAPRASARSRVRSSRAPPIPGAPITSGSSTTYTQSTRSRGATLTGGIYPNGSGTSWWIEYGTTNSYGTQTPATDIGPGTAPVAVTGYLSGLAPATTYHYRLVAQNGLGTTYGYDSSFTT